MIRISDSVINKHLFSVVLLRSSCHRRPNASHMTNSRKQLDSNSRARKVSESTSNKNIWAHQAHNQKSRCHCVIGTQPQGSITNFASKKCHPGDWWSEHKKSAHSQLPILLGDLRCVASVCVCSHAHTQSWPLVCARTNRQCLHFWP